MKPSPRRPNAVTDMVREPDLVRLALVLAGATRTKETLGRALRVLRDTAPGTVWALLDRETQGRYGVSVTAPLGADAVRALLCAACGESAMLDDRILETRGAPRAGPRWYAVAEPESVAHGEPELVLAAWSATERRLPAHGVVAVAARLIASAVRTARILESLLEQSARDVLTATLNRRGILDALRRESARARRHRRPLSILFLDLDRFKEINDRHGHRAGDDVLTAVARRLSGALRASDSVGRVGGDEFLVVLPDTPLSAARRIARRLAKLASAAPVATAAGSVAVSLTAGAALLGADASEERVIEQADLRMLQLKRRRSRLRLAEEDDSITAAPAHGALRGA